MENKKAKVIIIIICSLLICGIGSYFVYSNRPVEVYVEPTPVAMDEKLPVKNQYVKQMNKVNIYGAKCDIKIPGINATLKGAKELNAKILKDYANIIEDSKKETPSAPYEVSYEYTYEPYLKYVYITITTKIMNNISCATYIYDVKQDREITKDEIFANYGITIPKIKNRIKAITNINIDITALADNTVEKNLCIKYLDSNKLTLEFVYMAEQAEVTYSMNEKVNASLVMDAINEKKDMGNSTEGGYKLTVNIKLPKVKIDTQNARAFNEKIRKIYDNIMEYYVIKEVVPATNDEEENKEKTVQQIINSYDVNYKYSYIEELGCIYITITTKELSGKETEKEHVKILTSYKTYLYNVAEDKEMDIDELLRIFNMTDDLVISKIMKENNISVGSNDEKNIKLAILDKSNISVVSLIGKKIELRFKVGTKEYNMFVEK